MHIIMIVFVGSLLLRHYILVQYLLGIAGLIIRGGIPAVLFNSVNREEQHEIATQP